LKWSGPIDRVIPLFLSFCFLEERCPERKGIRVEIKPDRRFIKAKRGFSLRSGIQFSSADAATLL